MVSVAALAPIHAIMVVTGILIVADLVTGIWAAVKKGDKINSAALRRTVSKFLIYQLAVISAFIVQKYMLNDLIPASNIVASAIGLVELKSILENASRILGADVFKVILSKLGSINDNQLKEVVKQVESTNKQVENTDKKG
jgi:phage-related holin